MKEQQWRSALRRAKGHRRNYLTEKLRFLEPNGGEHIYDADAQVLMRLVQILLQEDLC